MEAKGEERKLTRVWKITHPLSRERERRQTPDAEKIKFTFTWEKNSRAIKIPTIFAPHSLFPLSSFYVFIKEKSPCSERVCIYSRIESMFVWHGSDFHEGGDYLPEISESDQGSVPMRSHVLFSFPLPPSLPPSRKVNQEFWRWNFRKLLRLTVQTFMILRGTTCSDETWSFMPFR